MRSEFHYWATLLIPIISSGAVGWFLRTKVHEIHVSLNSRLSQLIASSRELGHAEGIKEGQSANVADVARAIANVADMARAVAGQTEPPPPPPPEPPPPPPQKDMSFKY